MSTLSYEDWCKEEEDRIMVISISGNHHRASSAWRWYVWFREEEYKMYLKNQNYMMTPPMVLMSASELLDARNAKWGIK